jgi:hypothetical protein
MKHKVKMEGFTLAGTFLFMACGVDPSTRELQQTKSDPSVIAALSEEEISASYIPELKLSATEGVVRIKGTTLLKVSTIQGDDLDADEKCELDAGQELRFTSIVLSPLKRRHPAVLFNQAICSRITLNSRAGRSITQKLRSRHALRYESLIHQI